MARSKPSAQKRRKSWLLASVYQRLTVVVPLLLLIWALTVWALSEF